MHTFFDKPVSCPVHALSSMSLEVRPSFEWPTCWRLEVMPNSSNRLWHQREKSRADKSSRLFLRVAMTFRSNQHTQPSCGRPRILLSRNGTESNALVAAEGLFITSCGRLHPTKCLAGSSDRRKMRKNKYCRRAYAGCPGFLLNDVSTHFAWGERLARREAVESKGGISWTFWLVV